eukprot:TRINITY_DN15537_c0_g1_i1.p1 TRINITY_DN15537_c0_g1~~TRINITY_DN15537_c0_g1_i1.p1  ORF type:complete len:101 (+),score=25.18 TRINITY_DN15537_c0_g1_i1:182-484(+)
MLPLAPTDSPSLQSFLALVKAKSAKLQADKSLHYGFDFAKGKPLADGNTQFVWEGLPENSQPNYLRSRRPRPEATVKEALEVLSVTSCESDERCRKKLKE